MHKRKDNLAAWGFYAAGALILTITFVLAPSASAFTANKVWFETLPTGVFRVNVNYTVPALREFREAYAEFKVRAEAEAFYWDLVRGADFYLPNPKLRRFTAPPVEPTPW